MLKSLIHGVLLLLLSGLAHSATYTVSLSGNDSNSGSAVSPWRTVQKAANTAVGGDTVTILAGTFVERVTFPNSGSAGNPITFVGTRSGASWLTAIDGSDSTSGWVTAPEVGAGVWKNSTIGYAPQGLVSGDFTVWKIQDSSMNGAVNFGTNGDGFFYLAESASAFDGNWLVNRWDGIEAKYGNRSGITYLRFRNGDNPAGKSVRVSPGSTITITNKSYITLRDLQISRGAIQVEINGSNAHHIIVEQCFLQNGNRKVALIGGAHDNIVRFSTITTNHIGAAGQYKPGDQQFSSYARSVIHTMYEINKFLSGETRENDIGVLIGGGGTAVNNEVSDSTITEGIVGIELRESTGTKIYRNTIGRFAAEAIWYLEGYSAEVAYNLIYDSDHLMRIHIEYDKNGFIYANRFFNPRLAAASGTYEDGDGGKHIHYSIIGAKVAQPGAFLWVYQNSFAGGGWSNDLGAQGEGPVGMPNVHIFNNIQGTRGFSSGGGISPPITAELANNYTEGSLWRGVGTSLPNFVLPPGHAALNTAPSLIPRTNPVLPGMNSAYYGDGAPNYGAMQDVTGVSPFPAPTNLRMIVGP